MLFDNKGGWSNNKGGSNPNWGNEWQKKLEEQQKKREEERKNEEDKKKNDEKSQSQSKPLSVSVPETFSVQQPTMLSSSPSMDVNSIKTPSISSNDLASPVELSVSSVPRTTSLLSEPTIETQSFEAPTVSFEPTVAARDVSVSSLSFDSEPTTAPETTTSEAQAVLDPLSGDIVNSITGEVIMEKDMMSNEYRSLANLAQLPSTAGSSWIAAANQPNSSNLLANDYRASQNLALLPSDTGSSWIDAAKASSASSIFDTTPVGVKGALQPAGYPSRATTGSAQQVKVGNIIGPQSRGVPEGNPLLRTNTPKVNDMIGMSSQNKSNNTFKPNVIKSTTKGHYDLKLVQVSPNQYKIEIYDKYSLGLKPKASSGTLTREQALKEFERLKGEQPKVTL